MPVTSNKQNVECEVSGHLLYDICNAKGCKSKTKISLNIKVSKN